MQIINSIHKLKSDINRIEAKFRYVPTMNQNLINHNSHNGNDEDSERDEELKAIQDEESKVRYDDKSNNDI